MIRSSSFLLLILAAALVACGSSESSSQGSSADPTAPAGSCEATTRALCERACDCGRCVIAYGTAVTEKHASLADCTDFYRSYACAQPDADGYGEACRAALDVSACVATATKGSAVAFPAACRK